MKVLSFFTLTALAWSQTLTPAPRPELTPDTVVLESDGKKYTVQELNEIISKLPSQMRQNYERDPKGFLQQWFMLKKVSAMAEAAKLGERTPYKEGIEIARMTVLWQAQIEETTKSMKIEEAELRKYYDEKKDHFLQAKLKLIYIPFVNQPPAGAERKSLTETEALAKAEKLVAQARQGADFVKLVRENSEDPISKERDGDFGPIKKSDTLPEAIKQAVFALKPGEISDPVRQPNGYYIFRMIEFAPQAFDEVRVALENELRSLKIRQWMDANAKAVELKVERPDFFGAVK
ncbi:MAG: peptidylprolyl isomerase [Bryobacteraceae bacterium]|nr:peptidylprolyl isomerase [Bryobacteraceae bacterium]MDW8378123.1 peptidylprolyl isomerase [Bryobacterales bacterium]